MTSIQQDRIKVIESKLPPSLARRETGIRYNKGFLDKSSEIHLLIDISTRREKSGDKMTLEGETICESCDSLTDDDGLTRGECAAPGGPVDPCEACFACCCDGSC